MAKAVQIKPKLKRAGVKLTLSAAEADTLTSILSKVGGQPSSSPRGHAQAISDALTAATGRNWPQVKDYKLAIGGIKFLDYGSQVDDDSGW